MFKQELKDKYPFLANYFETGINHPVRSLAHSILLYGSDVASQYEIAKEIARILNCNELKTEDCNCINCNWIRENSHPAVLTISKIDNKPSEDKSSTVISVLQAQMVKNSLLNTSDYHRVFIFCDAEIKDGVWIPMGLNESNFHQETANSLLKTIEEPPENTTFFFLTRDKNDLISTIISRSQSFFVPTLGAEIREYSNIEEIFSDYLNFKRKNCFDLAQTLFNLSKEKTPELLLDEVQNYLYELIKSNLENKALTQKILNDLEFIEIAKKQIKSHLNPLLAFEDMFLNIVK